MKIILTEEEFKSIAGSLLLNQDLSEQVKNVQRQVRDVLVQILSDEGIGVCFSCLSWNYTTDRLCADCRDMNQHDNR